MPVNPTGPDLLQAPAPRFKDRVRSFMWRSPLLWAVYNLRHFFKGSQSLFLDYRVEPRSRYGYGRPPHAALLAMFDQERASYRGILERFRAYSDALARIPLDASDDRSPYWNNGWMPPLDGAALYYMLAERKPRLYLEVGSGNSTKFARRAIEDHKLSTRIVSIDPHPRAEINALCDRVVRTPLQDADLSVFADLQSGDVLFLDNSHVLLTNSDVTVAFMEVLPSLPAGVLVQVHDIFLPYDYPPRWAHRYFNEQYVLAFALLEQASRLQVLLPNAYVAADPELSAVLAPLWDRIDLPARSAIGLSFWMLTR
jgi:predicted O-methyltransferase YrrM